MKNFTLFSAAAILVLASLTSAQQVFPPPQERLRMNALAITAPINIDGKLAETDWWRAAATKKFRQADPKQGEAATFDTEVRLLFDENNLYVGAICRDTSGAQGVRVPDLRRDFNYFENDVFGVTFDPFRDQRNSLAFQVNPNTVLDLTANTDFAQAEADRQVINLTRFSVFFPEKRQFFLENAGLFDELGSSSTIKPFFGRRIGLDPSGLPIPIDAGLRLTSRSPQRTAGALLIRQRGNENNPASHFLVGRYSQNVGAKNRLGGLVTYRHDESFRQSGAVQNLVANVDGLFRLTRTLTASGVLSRSWTEGRSGDGYASHVWIYNDANWGYVGHYQAFITSNYNAAAGFVTRQNLIVTSPAVTLDWRPQWKPSFVRSFKPGFTMFAYHRAADGKSQEGYLSLRPIRLALQNGGELVGYVRPEWQRLEAEEVKFFRPFGVELRAGAYNDVRYGLSFASDKSRRYAGSFEASGGGYIDGRLNTVKMSGKISPSPSCRVDG